MRRYLLIRPVLEKMTGVLLVALAGAAVADDTIVTRWEQPRRESFDLKAVSPQQAAEELAKRYGIALKVGATGAAAPADFAANGVTFFEALDRLAGLHGLVLSGAPVTATGEWREPHPLTLVRPKEGVRPIAAVSIGASRLSVESVFVVTQAQCAPEPEEEEMALGLGGFQREETPGLGLRLRWIAEPEFEGIGHFALEVTAAEDDTGERIEAGGDDLPDWLDSPTPANRDFVLRLARPSPKAKAIKKLEGKLKVAIPVERARVEFTADEVGRTKDLGAAKVTLDSIDGEKKTVSVTMRGTPCADLGERGYPDLLVGSEDRVWRGSWSGDAIRILPCAADGREIQQGDDGTDTNADDGKWTAKIVLEAVPSRIAVEALVRAAVREAKFSFADIPLPE